MENQKRSVIFSTLFAILIWGGLWGVFEATVGYLLHMLPFSTGWFVWYPVACFFMLNVYRKTQQISSVLFVGLLSACIKLLNLFLPVRIDKVLNPAFSIMFEALALAAVIFAVKRFFEKKKRTPLVKGLAVLCMNTGWRILYMLYLLFLVPDWMREISVISSTEVLITFFFIHNLFTSLILFSGAMVVKYIFKPIKVIEDKLSVSLSSFSHPTAAGIKIAVALCLLCSSIALGMLL